MTITDLLLPPQCWLLMRHSRSGQLDQMIYFPDREIMEVCPLAVFVFWNPDKKFLAKKNACDDWQGIKSLIILLVNGHFIKNTDRCRISACQILKKIISWLHCLLLQVKIFDTFSSVELFKREVGNRKKSHWPTPQGLFNDLLTIWDKGSQEYIQEC